MLPAGDEPRIIDFDQHHQMLDSSSTATPPGSAT